MSGGFFRGTSADQDTRFSNKQAKLLKSQKFAPELENLVDMTKVKMDVMRPWIAHRVTELLGFEDEVLINFIYGLLEEKVVNGKKIQISLTGFMEKNTGKFMKELWTHLLSAQKNASGVPQQFLDAKEEETRKKQADRDRITSELKRTKEKEGQELEQGRMKKMDGEADNVKAASLETHSRSHTRVSSKWSVDEKETNERDGSKGRNRISRSPCSADRSPSLPRGTRSKSISKSSNSRSHTRSRSLSSSPRAIQRSISSERRRCSPSRRSFTPRRVDSPLRSLSPARQRRYRSRHRSPSPARRRLRSPMRHRSRSPVRRRSPSPMRRRSRSPLRRRSRSPMRRRSRSPIRRRSRSPIWRRSRSPIRRRSRSPIRRRSRSPTRRRSQSPFGRRSRPAMRYRSRSPVARRSRSPLRHISQSPVHSRSSSSARRRSPSPMRRRYRRAPSTPLRRSPSPARRRTTFHSRQRSSSPGSMSPSRQGRISQSPIHRTPPSPPRRSLKRQQRSPVQPPREGHRIVQENSPEQLAEGRKKSGSLGIRSPERVPKAQSSYSRAPALSSPPYNSPSSSESPPTAGRRIPSKERSPIPPLRQREIIGISDDAEVEETKISRGKKDEKSNSLGKVITHSPTNDKEKDTFNGERDKKHSPERIASHHSSEIQAQKEKSSGNDVRRRYYSENSQEFPHTHRNMTSDGAHKSEKGYRADGIDDSLTNDVKGSPRQQEAEKMPKLSPIVERNDRSGSMDSGSEERDELRGDVEKRKRKRSKRKDVTSDSDHGHDSRERKEAKRRRKLEKRLKKEEKRRRREERRRRKEDRRTEKLKLRTGCNLSPHSDSEKNYDGHASDGEQIAKSGANVADNEHALSDEKKLEIELREKALRSLRAKKGVGH